MAKIQRKHQKVFAENATNNGQFGSGQDGTKITSTDLDTLQANSAFSEGWLQAVLSGDNLPPLEEFQSLNYINTTQLAYLFQEGVAEYNESTEYHQNSIVKKTGTLEIYASLVDTNTDNALPSKTSDANWRFVADFSAPLIYSYEDTGTANAYDLSIRGGFSDTGSYSDGMIVLFKVGNANTGASTLKVGSLGVKNLTDASGSALIGGELSAGAYVLAVYDMTNDRFELITFGGSGNASTIAKGVVQKATVAEVKAETATGSTGAELFVTPEDMVQHHGVAKSWGSFNGSGTVALQDGFNVSSISDLAVGRYTVNTSVTFANNDFSFQAICNNILDVGGSTVLDRLNPKTTSSATFYATRGDNGTPQDSTVVDFTIHGELA